MTERYKYFNYNITTDTHLLDEISHITPELHRQMEMLYRKAEKGGSKNIELIKKKIKQYPRVPQLKNYLSSAYMNSGMEEKSYEINDWIMEEHPNYLFGILNKANEYYLKGQHEEMPEILGENLELSELYPEREEFHISEVFAFFKCVICYYTAEENWEAAESRLEMMKKIEPDHPETQNAENIILRSRIDAGLKHFLENDEARILPELKSYDKSVQTDQPPEFHNQIINKLYESDYEINQDILKEIQSLPRESVISDLRKVLHDSIYRYEFYNRQFEDGEVTDENLFFPVHAVFLLGDLEASEATNDILETFRQGKEFLDFWYQDFLLEIFWLPLYKLAGTSLETFMSFMLEPGIHTYAKSTISKAILQYYLYHPEQRDKIVSWYEKIFKEYQKNEVENLIDSDLNGFLICDVLEANFQELLPIINKFYDSGFVSEDIPGTKEEVNQDFEKDNSNQWKNPILTIYEQYDEITNKWYSIDKEEESYYDKFRDLTDNNPLGNAPANLNLQEKPKVGRNDPCPCGSGKKYKKCCWNKKMN